MLSASLAFAYLAAATAAGLPQQRVLPMDVARDLAATASAKCLALGYNVTVTVLDRGGQPVVMLRDVGAPPHTVESSRRKAYTALTFRRPSNEFAELATNNALAAPLLNLDGVIALGGGMPIRSHGELVGAIGVGGAPSGDRDIICAQAGLDAIAAKLR